MSLVKRLLKQRNCESILDMIAARLEHFERFSLHDLDAMAASADRLRGLWPQDAPYRSYLDGMAAFSHEELGHYGIAEELGREAVETAPIILWRPPPPQSAATTSAGQRLKSPCAASAGVYESWL